MNRRPMSNRTSHLTIFLAAGAITGMLAACSPPVETRGNLPDPELLAEIQPGIYSEEEVIDLLGTPSSIATFDNKTWYYISKQTKSFAFFEPEILDQQVVIIEFDDGGLVKNIRHYNLEDGQTLEMIDRTTPTRGKELTFFQQLIDNFGNFYTRDPFNR